MNILLLTKYSSEAASSRYRSFQYVEYFQANNANVIVQTLFDSSYVKSIKGNKLGKILSFVCGYIKRIVFLLLGKHRNYDLIFIEKELFPWIPYEVEDFFLRGVSYVLDYDDAIFHTYDLNPNKLVRLLLSNKINKLMSNSNLVVAGNKYLAQRAKDSQSSLVEIIPTVVDLSKYPVVPFQDASIFTIGWIGSPTTTQYIQSLSSVFKELSSDRKIKILVVGANCFHIEGVDIEVIPWSENSEIENLQKIDVGVMPLDSSPWSKGKCGFKLIQYMASCKPVVASPTGVNSEIVEHETNGFLASTNEDWITYLIRLYDDKNLRSSMGKKGRIKVEEEYCLQVTAPKLFFLLRSLMDKKNKI
jgi:glycosyltransferase involved in cell wall biosynthesis